MHHINSTTVTHFAGTCGTHKPFSAFSIWKKVHFLTLGSALRQAGRLVKVMKGNQCLLKSTTSILSEKLAFLKIEC